MLLRRRRQARAGVVGCARVNIGVSYLKSGRLAQLGEHHVRNVGVVGSNPMPSTNPKSSVKTKRDQRAKTFEEAWIGDAVLALYARSRILRDSGTIDNDKAVRMTANRFLGTFGEPTEVEAEIGRVYAADGLEAAFEWIHTRLMPIHDKQEAVRVKRLTEPHLR